LAVIRGDRLQRPADKSLPVFERVRAKPPHRLDEARANAIP
jgi:hypothetical protein